MKQKCLLLVRCMGCNNLFLTVGQQEHNDHARRYVEVDYPYCYFCAPRPTPFQSVVDELVKDGPKKGRKRK